MVLSLTTESYPPWLAATPSSHVKIAWQSNGTLPMPRNAGPVTPAPSLQVNQRQAELNLVLRWVPDGKLAENRRRRMVWRAYAELLGNERETANGLILEALDGQRPYFGQCTLSIQFFFKRHGKGPDYENLVAREKVVVDALVHIGIIPDDSWEVVVDRHTLRPVMGASETDATVILVERTLGGTP